MRLYDYVRSRGDMFCVFLVLCDSPGVRKGHNFFRTNFMSDGVIMECLVTGILKNECQRPGWFYLNDTETIIIRKHLQT